MNKLFFIIVLMLAGSSAQCNFTLWQLPACSDSQMMSYVLQTKNGNIIVIDGGTKIEGTYLKDFINAHGGCVDAWFLTHHHSDHVGALTAILDMDDKPRIKRIYASLAPEEFFRKYEPIYIDHLEDLNAAIVRNNVFVNTLVAGAVFIIDGVKIEVLRVSNTKITVNAGNNSSCVFRIGDSSRKILFLGDLGVEGGRELLASPQAKNLKADYVQMAHHGQNGTEKAVYEAIGAKVCLWTAPSWLWDNNSGAGVGSGPWTTLETRAWMDELGVKKHYVLKDGLLEIK